MIRVGIVGYGYWGPNIVRNFLEVKGTEVVAICDLSKDQLARAQARYPSIKCTTDFKSLLEDPSIDAITIATPVKSHFDLALEVLKAGKHLFLEKPMTETSTQAKRLIDEAKKRNLVLMVDHTFLYTGAVRKIRELVNQNELGKIFFYDSTRINLGNFQHDVNVIWDLAVHDLSILDYVLQDFPIAVSATGASHVRGQPENSAFISLFFNNSTIAHINVNWLSPIKLRRTLIGGSRKMILYDDLEVTEKIKVYDKGVDIIDDPESVYQVLKGYRMGDMWAPNLSTKEALTLEIEHFIECIEKGAYPLTDGEMGLRMVQLLEAATQSMLQRGVPVEIGKKIHDPIFRSEIAVPEY